MKKWAGNPIESEEMKPAWFNINDIPIDKMWPDDKFWIPLFLDNRKFKGNFLFDKEGKILKHNLKAVEKI